MNTFSQVPPGFRFHPTDEELVDYYLRKKVASRRIDLDVIKDVDLYKIEPWDLQEICRIGTEEQNEWYFFSHKDKKYPTGTRTNRATAAGFWKATGRDKAIYSKQDLVGMRKTLVFYKGRAPNGQKSDWIMHEYRLETDENGSPQEEGWVVCRVFKKRVTTTTMRKVVMREHDESPSCSWYDHDQAAAVSFMDDHSPNPSYPNCKKELLDHINLPPLFQQIMPHHQFLPLLQSNNPNIIMPPPHATSLLPSSLIHQQDFDAIYGNDINEQAAGVDDQVTDWRVLDKFVASQLSQDINNNIFQGTTDIDSNNSVQLITSQDQQTFMEPHHHHHHQNASSSISSTCPIDLWK